MRKLTSKYMDKYFLGFFFLQQNMTYNYQLETPLNGFNKQSKC